MSDERAKVIEAFFDAWNRRDLAAALELIGEDFEYVNPPNAIEPGTRRGTDGITDVMSQAVGGAWRRRATGDRSDCTIATTT